MSSLNTKATDAEIVNGIKGSSILFITIWSIGMFFFGIIGHALSIYVFTRRSLRSNPCAQYFLGSAITGLGVVLTNVPLRFLQRAYRIDVFVTSNEMCRIMSWILFSIRPLPAWSVTLACADRFFCSSTSARVRSWSSVRVAPPVISIMILLAFISYAHVPVYTVLSAGPTCAFPSGVYNTFFGVSNLILFSLGPCVIMLIFGFLTVRNVRQRRARVVPINTETKNQNGLLYRRRAADRQLIHMMLLQCIFFILTATPTSLYYCYTASIANVPLNAVETARINWTSTVISFISLTGPCMSFYVFTLASPLFRRELMQLLRCRQQMERASTLNTVTARQRQ